MLRNKLRYLLLLASMAILSVLYNKYYMGIVFLTVFAMPFLLFGLLSFMFGKVKAELVSVAHVANKGEAIPISIQLTNPTIFPISNLKIYLTYKNAYSNQKFKKSFLISLDYRTKTSVICNLYSEYAGNLEISLDGIRIYDYMKLFSLKKKIKGELKVAVLPYYYELENNLSNKNTPLVESDYYSTTKGGDDPSEVFTIREYREGDRLQRIHWKLSRKQDQLMIKEFSDPINCSILLFANLSIPKEENILHFMDAILECALSLSYSYITRGQTHYLTWYDGKHGACRRIRIAQEKDLFEAVDSLLQAIPYTDSTDALSAYLAEHPHDQYTDLIYVTSEVTTPRVDSLSLIKALTRQVICVGNTHDDTQHISEDVIKLSSDMGIHLWPIDIGNVKRDIEQLRLS
jgi:uncharacterized protein (DUF58 family)